MVSYPGEILRRFGRYEAVADLGTRAAGHFWRAWDPYLERFVRIASLPGLDAAELYQTLPRLSYALRTWLEEDPAVLVLDFDPGKVDRPAFFVFCMEAIGPPPARVAPHEESPKNGLHQRLRSIKLRWWQRRSDPQEAT